MNYTTINLIIPEIIYILNYVVLVIYYGLYTISNKYKYLLSYRQISLLPTLLILSVILLELNYPFRDNYLWDSFIYITEYNNYIKLFTNIVTAIIFMSSYTYIKATKLNNFETPILILSAQLGVLTLLMSNNIILLYLSLELVTITIYILVALNKINNYSIEAGLKYFIVGAVSSGLFLLGLSILYGNTGIININNLKVYTGSHELFIHNNNGILDFYMILASLCIILSLLFKVYCAPFHLWISDIYQGTPKHILAYISTIPSLANFIVLIKFLEIFNEIYHLSYIMLFFSIITIIGGAIGALLQRKIKRLLAYSSITHVGYFLIAISVYLFDNVFGLFTFYFYYIIYILNLILLFNQIIQNNNVKAYNIKIDMDQLNDYRGHFKLNSFYISMLMIVLFSVAGIPPFIGFFGKLYVLLSMVYTKYSLYVQIFFILMAVISCYYYLNIIKNIYFNKIKIYTFIQYNITNNIITMILTVAMTLFIFYMNYYSIVIYNVVLNYIY